MAVPLPVDLPSLPRARVLQTRRLAAEVAVPSLRAVALEAIAQHCERSGEIDLTGVVLASLSSPSATLATYVGIADQWRAYASEILALANMIVTSEPPSVVRSRIEEGARRQVLELRRHAAVMRHLAGATDDGVSDDDREHAAALQRYGAMEVVFAVHGEALRRLAQ